ncbi:DUF6221 family protein [Isoptericola sp. QY 916]|uniref:DUF6221 family protein n=1 Tax=Isoptericola sp. QY 916 TaxID=2782570 RepID=UPI003D2FAED3|nr:hypothetical protein [Isoptericola sp. QY 916]
MTITEFLTARFNEEEAAARETLAKRPNTAAMSEHLAEHEISDAEAVSRAAARKLTLHETNSWLVGLSPHRVLDDVEAKRKVVALYRFRSEQADPGVGMPDVAAQIEARAVGQVLRILSLPYDGHPDYDWSWRP